MPPFCENCLFGDDSDCLDNTCIRSTTAVFGRDPLVFDRELAEELSNDEDVDGYERLLMVADEMLMVAYREEIPDRDEESSCREAASERNERISDSNQRVPASGEETNKNSKKILRIDTSDAINLSNVIKEDDPHQNILGDTPQKSKYTETLTGDSSENRLKQHKDADVLIQDKSAKIMGENEFSSTLNPHANEYIPIVKPDPSSLYEDVGDTIHYINEQENVPILHQDIYISIPNSTLNNLYFPNSSNKLEYVDVLAQDECSDALVENALSSTMNAQDCDSIAIASTVSNTLNVNEGNPLLDINKMSLNKWVNVTLHQGTYVTIPNSVLCNPVYFPNTLTSNLNAMIQAFDNQYIAVNQPGQVIFNCPSTQSLNLNSESNGFSRPDQGNFLTAVTHFAPSANAPSATISYILVHPMQNPYLTAWHGVVQDLNVGHDSSYFQSEINPYLRFIGRKYTAYTNVTTMYHPNAVMWSLVPLISTQGP